MNNYLFAGDYTKAIQAVNLAQISGGSQNVIDAVQAAAVAECISYLKSKYDVSSEFQPVVPFDPTQTYNAGQTAYLDATAYDQTLTYILGALTLFSGGVYFCSTVIMVAEVFNPLNWTLLGPQYSLYFTQQPESSFDYKAVYKIGDLVFWRNKVYTALRPTTILSHADKLEIGTIVPVSVLNVFPDDDANGFKYWGTGITYQVPANTQINNATYWTPGDNRDQKLLMICIDIALYHLHARISPVNVPELRIHRYMGLAEDRAMKAGRVIYPTYSALGWLQAAADGTDITPELPKLQPAKGARIRYGGNPKLINSY